MPDEVPLIWRPTRIPKRAPPYDPEGAGTCWDGDMAVGRVTRGGASDFTIKYYGAWWWSMFVTGFGADYPSHHGRHHTKDEAKAAVERCYRRLIAAHPGNRDAALAHDAMRRRIDRAREARLRGG